MTVSSTTSHCTATRRRARTLGVLLSGSLLVWGAGVRMSQAGGRSQTHHVAIEAMRYTPQELTVRPGDRIVWINKDPFPHTATADHETFDSRSIAPSASWTFVARKPGEYDYTCTFHPTMKGKLTVK